MLLKEDKTCFSNHWDHLMKEVGLKEENETLNLEGKICFPLHSTPGRLSHYQQGSYGEDSCLSS